MERRVVCYKMGLKKRRRAVFGDWGTFQVFFSRLHACLPRLLAGRAVPSNRWGDVGFTSHAGTLLLQ